MWNLDDTSRYQLVANVSLPWAWTFAETRPGRTDVEKRERIRGQAVAALAAVPPGVRQWAFRILVRKRRGPRFDIENVPKLIIDAFCKRQVAEDESKYGAAGLYEDDTIDQVVIVEVAGERTADLDSTEVEIFAVKQALGRGAAVTAG